MHVIKDLIILFTVLFLVSCISPTPYRNKSATLKDGLIVKKLSSNKYQIIFHGNEDTSQERANDFALLRAAQETIIHGYQYLTILRMNSTTTSKNYKFSNESYEPIKVVKKDGSVIFTRDYATNYGESARKYAISRPEVFATVKFIGNGCERYNVVYKAKDVISSLSKKYSINISLNTVTQY